MQGQLNTEAGPGVRGHFIKGGPDNRQTRARRISHNLRELEVVSCTENTRPTKTPKKMGRLLGKQKTITTCDIPTTNVVHIPAPTPGRLQLTDLRGTRRVDAWRAREDA